jgi:rRNA-processing protein FCF1
MNLEPELLGSIKNEILINDSCIFFDLIDLELLETFFMLDYGIVTTSYVIGEITQPDQLEKILKYKEINKLSIVDGSFTSILSLINECPGLSITDCSILELSITERATIISNDKRLTSEAKKRNIQVKGLLWIIQEMIIEKILTIELALEKLTLYPMINKWVPKNEIDKIIQRIKSEEGLQSML